MKKVLAMVVILMSLNGCQKEIEELGSMAKENLLSPARIASGKTLQEKEKDAIIEKISRAVAYAINDIEFLTFIRNETLKQFDYDFDILLSLVANKKINSNKYGSISIKNFLQKNSPESISDEEFDEIFRSFKNLQISMTLNGEKWDPRSYKPKVASLTSIYDEKTQTKIKCFSSDGSYVLLSDKEAKDTGEVFLIVRESERVDKEGMLKVDESNIVIPKNERKVSSEAAYNAVNLNLKRVNFSKLNANSLISKASESELKELTKFSSLHIEKQLTEFNKNNRNVISHNNRQARLMSCPNQPATPTNLSVYPVDYNTMRIEWQGVPGASYYRLYREGNFSGNVILIHTTPVNSGTTVFIDAPVWNTINYAYYVEAVNADGCASVRSLSSSAYASVRTNDAMEKLHKVYLSNDAWDWCVGFLDNKIELEFKLIRYRKDLSQVAMDPIALPQRGDYAQRGQAHQYDKDLFHWNITQYYSYNYAIYMWEEDADGDGFDVNLGFIFKAGSKEAVEVTASASVSFKISNRDEVLGTVEVWHHLPTGSLYNYNLSPQQGTAYIQVVNSIVF